MSQRIFLLPLDFIGPSFLEAEGFCQKPMSAWDRETEIEADGRTDRQTDRQTECNA